MPARKKLVGLAAVAVLALGGASAAALLSGSGSGGGRTIDTGRAGPGRITTGPRVNRTALALMRLGEGPSGSAPVTLNNWTYRSDPGDRGRARGWARGRFSGRRVKLPFSPNAAHVTGPKAEASYAGSIGWYTRTIDVPVAGRYSIAFGSAHHIAVVYVDGRRARRHVGAYEPFTVADDFSKGRHTIAVRVDWRDPRGQADTGYARGWFNFGGLNRAVTLARVGGSELGAVTIGTRLRAGSAVVRVSARVRNRGVARRITPQGSLRFGGARVPLAFSAVRVPADTSRTITATVRIASPALWSPQDPQLYDLELVVPGEAAIRRKVGLRELRWGGARLRLNGRRLRLWGAGLPADAEGHGDAMTAADERRIVRELVASGANATRSQMPLADSMLDRLDAAGILVWQEVGPWEQPAGFHSSSVGAARDRALRTAELEQTHPSVVAWTLTNEVLSSGSPEQVDYVVQTAEGLHRSDPTRPVAADLWGRHLTKVDGPLFRAVDALGVTDYTGWYEGTDLAAAGQAAAVRARLEGLRRLFPDKPIVVTELGAVGTPLVASGAFGSLRFQADLLTRRIGMLRDLPDVSGALVWLLRDHALRPDFDGGSVLGDHPGLTLTRGINEKGLYDYAGHAKPALRAVRRAFSGGG